MIRALVTGGAGFVGSNLIRCLLEQNYDVINFDNLTRGRRTDFGTFIHGDIRDRSALETSLAGVEVIFHLAAQANVLGAVADLDYSFSANVLGTFNVLSAAQKLGVRRVIFTSSREVYGEVKSLPVPESFACKPKNAYGVSKLAGELYCNSFPRLEVTTLRLSNVYGPGDCDRVIPLFVEAALADNDLTIYGHNKLLDFVWIEDVIAALIGASILPLGGQTINIGSGIPTTLPQLARRIVDLTNSKSAIRYEPARNVEVDRYVADIRVARDLLGFKPKSDALYGVDQIIDSLSNESYKSAYNHKESPPKEIYIPAAASVSPLPASGTAVA